VIELRFHEELYDGFAIDEAVKAFAGFATMDLTRDGGAYVVKVTAGPEALEKGIDERVISAELGNYALGLSIERARSAGAS
jgi:hypothetical protein